MQQDKNFSIRLKAATDRAFKNSGLKSMALKGAKDYEDFKASEEAFFNAIENISLEQLQGIKSSPNPPTQ